MNQNNIDKPLTGLFAQNNASTHILFTNRAVSLARYLEEDITQPEEFKNRERDKGTNQQPPNSARGRSEVNTLNNPSATATATVTATVTATTIANDTTPKNATDKTNFSTTIDNEMAPMANKVGNPFLMANGNEVTPKVTRTPFKAPCKSKHQLLLLA
jgi:hypothetical protein